LEDNDKQKINEKNEKIHIISKRQFNDVETFNEQNIENYPNNKGKIKKFMLSYTYGYCETDKNIKWPENLYFGSRKYYLMNKPNDLINIKKKTLNYYCINHRYISKLKKESKICDSKIQYIKTEDEFYLINDHSGECNLGIKPTKKEIKENSDKIYKITNLRNDFIKYLNNNPHLNFKDFHKYAETELIKLGLNVYNNLNFYKNIFYPWKKTNICFKWYSIFQNNLNKINQIQL